MTTAAIEALSERALWNSEAERLGQRDGLSFRKADIRQQEGELRERLQNGCDLENTLSIH